MTRPQPSALSFQLQDLVLQLPVHGIGRHRPVRDHPVGHPREAFSGAGYLRLEVLHLLVLLSVASLRHQELALQPGKLVLQLLSQGLIGRARFDLASGGLACQLRADGPQAPLNCPQLRAIGVHL